MKKQSQIKVDNVLSGAHNKRLNNCDCQNSEATAAWMDVAYVSERGKVPIPSIEGTDEAKDWVDNGSKL